MRFTVPTTIVKAVIKGVQLRIRAEMLLAQGATKKNSIIITAPIKNVVSSGAKVFNSIPPYLVMRSFRNVILKVFSITPRKMSARHSTFPKSSPTKLPMVTGSSDK